MAEEPESEILSPYARADLIGHDQTERQIAQQIASHSFHHGWILTGPRGIGKATLAARIARVLLNPAARQNSDDLYVDKDAAIFRQVAQFGHPDFFIARREWDEKKGRYETEISVDRIRKLSSAFTHTATGEGMRVAIIDAADEMNHNAANALLKNLEEPPAKTVVILLAHMPGRLLPTIRSRCRVLHLRPVPVESVAHFVVDNTGCGHEGAMIAARASGGRPGAALQLVLEEGMSVLAMVERLINLAQAGGDTQEIVRHFAGKKDDKKWMIFKNHLLEILSRRSRDNATIDIQQQPDARTMAQIYLKAWEHISHLFVRGENLNMDHMLMVEAAGYDLTKLFNEAR